jgi:hypothetical protein
MSDELTCGKCGGRLWCVPGYEHKCPEPLQEMASLTAIKAALAEIRKHQKENVGHVVGIFTEHFQRLEENQGKLLAAIDHCPSSGDLRDLHQLLSEKFTSLDGRVMAIGNALGDLQGALEGRMDARFAEVMRRLGEHDEYARGINKQVDEYNATLEERKKQHAQALNWYQEQGSKMAGAAVELVACLQALTSEVNLTLAAEDKPRPKRRKRP